MIKKMINNVKLKFAKSFEESGGNYKEFLFHSALTLTFTSGLSYIFGFVRDRVLTQTFGVSRDLDIYYASFVIPDILLAVFVTTCVSAALVAIFSEKLNKSKQEARDYFYNVLSIISTILIILAILIAIFLPMFTKFLIKDFSQADTELYITIVRIMLLSPILFAFSNFFGGVLITTKEFFFYGIAPVFYNLGIIFGVFVLVPVFGIKGIAIGTIFGAFLHLGSRVFKGISKVGTPKISFVWDYDTKKTFKLMIPKIFQIGAWQILLWWFVYIASSMVEGSVSVYSIARNFQSMPVSLIGISIALSAFATLSHLSASKNMSKFREIVKKKSILIIVLTTISAVILALVSKFIIKILFGGGSFDVDDIQRVSALLVIYTISIPFESLMHILTRAHYALQKTFRPSIIHIIAIFITISISWYFKDVGIYIIPISFTVGLFVQNVLLYTSYIYLTNKKYGF